MEIQLPTYLPSENPRVPAATVPFRHRVDLQTRFADIDALGHVNNNVYFAFLDLGKMEYMKRIGGVGTDPTDVRAVIVHAGADFYAPAFYDEPLAVFTAITRVGQRSFTLEQRIVNTANGQTKCIGTSILCGFDPATQQSAPLDPAMIAAASDFEQRQL